MKRKHRQVAGWPLATLLVFVTPLALSAVQGSPTHPATPEPGPMYEGVPVDAPIEGRDIMRTDPDI